MDLRTLLATIRKPKTGRQEIEAALAKLDVDAAECAAEDLEAERRNLLVSGDDKDLAAVEEKIAAANRVIERSIAMRSELERRLAAIHGEEIEAERRQRFEAAKAATVEAGKAMAKYHGLARQIVDILETVAAAEVAIEATNKQLPVGEALLRSAEHIARGLGGAPREIVSQEKIEKWYYAGAAAAWGAVQENQIGGIKSDGGRSGELVVDVRNEGQPRRYPVERKTVLRTVLLEAQGADRVTPLAAAIHLPALPSGAADLWAPCGPDGLVALLGQNCHRVLEAVAARRTAPAQKPIDKQADREHVIEETILDDDHAGEVTA
ncbi:hypothetical protein [Mesorhizobium cantuariense]|uniref:Uncharacterized protein n=1 Tax=Mesorhizobium cantuariense TaxID=1300275 RepID=A0ABV7MP26_9HYPH